MAIEVRIPSLLQRVVGGQKTVQAEGTNVRQVFDSIENKHPGFRDRVLDEDGKLRHFVSVFVNEEDVRFLQELDTPVAEGAHLTILPAVAGGEA